MLKLLLITILSAYPSFVFADVNQIEVARFSQGVLEGWQSKKFSGETKYTLETENGRMGLRAISQSSASGLIKKVTINLKQTPIINWSWKIDHVLKIDNEHIKAGDDYPARLYVIFSDSVAFWRTRTINYVWSNNQPINTSWSNAFTKNAQMIAVQSGSNLVGKWVPQQRNVLEDYRMIFGTEPYNVDAVAIMTDTDNSSQLASSWYGNIWFSKE